MNAARPLNRSMTYQFYEDSPIQTFRSLSMIRRASDELDSSSFPRLTSQLIMVRPPAEKRLIQVLPRSCSDNIVEPLARMEKKAVETSSDEEIQQPEFPPLVAVNRAEVLPYMFLGHEETAMDARFLCEKRIFIIANLTPMRLELSKLRCFCDPFHHHSHEIKELLYPVTSETTPMAFQHYFQDFNSMIFQIRGKQINLLVYSNELQPLLLFATQFMMTYFKSEIARAKHQIEGNLGGKFQFSPRFQAILERTTQQKSGEKEKDHGEIKFVSSRRPSRHSVSSADSPKKKSRARSLGTQRRNNSVPLMPAAAFIPPTAISPLVVSFKSSEEENRTPPSFSRAFPRLAWN